ncbi:phosphoinositide-3-kinase-interacting protein 1 [Striga asiatica]|uniref:Phosphoinositide-3-kinase-interacting protein 1 n=1 Tax=Striga asiatica TaxID=4170 RepID=A0A5A7PHI9_STRAF|nr:phosphoinositide-3-kinase-interacting protein 1 [Striga asiatica]
MDLYKIWDEKVGTFRDIHIYVDDMKGQSGDSVVNGEDKGEVGDGLVGENDCGVGDGMIGENDGGEVRREDKGVPAPAIGISNQEASQVTREDKGEPAPAIGISTKEASQDASAFHLTIIIPLDQSKIISLF